MRGGIQTAEQAGLSVRSRDELRARIDSIGTRTLFRPEDIIAGDPALAADFAELRGHDYLHVVDGWYCGVVESPYLRMPPRLSDLIAAYEHLRGCTCRETGDWSAWRLGFTRLEPLEGHRFYSSGPTEVISLNTIRIRMISADGWLLEDEEPDRIVRAFCDTAANQIESHLRAFLGTAQLARSRLASALERAEAQDAVWFSPGKERKTAHQSPAQVMRSVMETADRILAERRVE